MLVITLQHTPRGRKYYQKYYSKDDGLDAWESQIEASRLSHVPARIEMVIYRGDGESHWSFTNKAWREIYKNYKYSP